MASLLVDALSNQGLNAYLEVVTKTDLIGTIGRHPLMALTTAIDNLVIKRQRSSQLFSLVRSSPRTDPDRYNRDDILHLHWTPGAVRLSRVLNAELNLPVVWTMHDMWPITGGCHHALECPGFTVGCHSCPVVRPVFRSTVSRHAAKKHSLLHLIPNLVICTPSKWLAHQVTNSSIAHDLDVRYVPNPIDLVFQDPTESAPGPSEELIRTLDSIPNDAFVVGFVAKNLEDPNKRLDIAVNILRGLRETTPSRRFILLAVGASRHNYSDYNIEIYRTGLLGSAADRKLAYQTMDVLLVASDAETAPLVIDESLACGTPVIVRDVGGSAESVTHGYSGIVCDSIEQLQLAVKGLAEDDAVLRRMSDEATKDRSHSLLNVISEYTRIYSELKYEKPCPSESL